MGWKLAPSLDALMNETNRRFPDRDRKSDGAIGDAAHQARRTDHNQARPSRYPPQFVADGGMVHAVDIDDDPVSGCDVDDLVAAIVARKDPRVRYVIRSRRIIYGPHSDGVKAGKKRAWVWESYDGINAHQQHAHVSVGYSAAAENDVSPWWATSVVKEAGFMGVEFKDKGELAEFIAKTVYGPGSETPRVAGTVNAKQVVETAATASRAAKESADRATAAVIALTKLFEAHVLKQGGSPNPTGNIK